MALDSFWIQDAEAAPSSGPTSWRGSPPASSMLVDRRRGIRGDRQPAAGPARAAPSLPGGPRVLIDNSASATYTVIEVNGRDRPGLLHRLTRALADLKLQIASAKISTFGERAVDVFYVKDQFGLKIDDERRLKAIRERLMAVLAEPLPARPRRPTRPSRSPSLVREGGRHALSPALLAWLLLPMLPAAAQEPMTILEQKERPARGLRGYQCGFCWAAIAQAGVALLVEPPKDVSVSLRITGGDLGHAGVGAESFALRLAKH